MSRARSGNGNANVTFPSKAGANPLESQPEHRAFLIRSLDRCDVEFAALLKLNRSLHSAKTAIIETCGEGTLLDLGEGLIKLTPHEDDLVGLRIPDNGQNLCVDFLLRMKLRRRLLNRVARRLNRLAQAMDGQDVSPPAPPKYGDLRLHIDPAQVQEYATHWEKQEAAKKRIAERRENVGDAGDLASLKPSLDEDYNILKEYNDSYEKALLPTTGAIQYTILDQRFEEDLSNSQLGAGIGSGHRSMSAREKEAEYKRWQTALLAKLPDQPSFSDIGMENRVFAAEERRKRIAKQALEAATKKIKVEDAVVDKLAGSADTDLSAEEKNPEAAEGKSINKGNQAEAMDVQDGDTESTVDDDAMDVDANKEETTQDAPEVKVELKEDDLADTAKMAIKNDELDADDDDADDDDVKMEKKKDKKKDEVTSDEGDADEDDDDDDSEEDSSEEDSGGKKTTKADKSDDGNDEEDEEEEKHEAPALPSMMKPMSLVAVPSFHEQDMKRIRLIHADLMASSITEHARARITETTNDYNNAYRLSTELYHRRVKSQEENQNLVNQHRMDMAKLNNDYSMRVSIAKARYMKEKQNWSLQKARQVMQNMQGQMPVGTQRTQMASARSNQIVNTVGLTLGRIVDAVVIKAERGSYDHEMFPPFQQPPTPDLNSIVVNRTTGETLSQRQNRLDTNLRNEIADLNSRFQKSEQERERAWRKLLKTKAEFDGGRRRFDPNLMPLPSLRSSGMVATPAASAPAAAVASYVPQNRSYAGPESQSKYSAARIRGRISSDGSVMPASEPKKGKDGLYIRPAGRKRAGMDWDAHRGIWVPEGQYRG